MGYLKNVLENSELLTGIEDYGQGLRPLVSMVGSATESRSSSQSAMFLRS